MRRDTRVNPNSSFYSGVTSRIFPLRADPSTLQSFIDKYLNHQALDNEHYFRAANSYVMFQVLNYPRMSNGMARLGYISQHEVLFGIPLHWYRRNPRGLSMFNDVRYELVKQRDTFFTPFVFVDNELSVLGGRELFGWPKREISINSHLSSWMVHPEEEDVVMTVDSLLFDQMFRGKDRQWMRLFEIRRDVSASQGQHQFQKQRTLNPYRNLYKPSVGMSGIQEHMQWHNDYWRDDFDHQLQGADPAYAAERLSDALMDQQLYQRAQQRPLLGRETNNIGLKQFRDTDVPELACYQALGNSLSRVEHVRGVGQLGSAEHAANDLAQGFRVHIYDYEQIPIVSSLGLIPSAQYYELFIFEPISPSWLDVDLTYKGAEITFLTEVHGEVVPQPDFDDMPDFQTEYDVVDLSEMDQPVGVGNDV